jgi:hypothetical protein
MGGILAIIGGLIGRLSFAGLLTLIQRTLATIGISWFVWKLERVGTVDKVAVATGTVATATGNVAAATGSIATATGNVAGATSGLSSDALLLLGGGLLVLFLMRR